MVVTCVSVVTTQALRVQLRGADGATGETLSHFFLWGTLRSPIPPRFEIFLVLRRKISHSHVHMV